MITSPTNRGLMIFFLGVLAIYSAYIGDKNTLSMIVVAFIALLKADE